ncbi:MAG: hypothetical protein ACO21J_05455 [Anaerohalosphaeraceae bacterium]|jgi:hypothetical protein
MSEKIENHLHPRRTVVSFCPFLLWTLPLIAVYGLGHWGLGHWCGRNTNEVIALPLVMVSVVGYGLLAWQRRNEFALLLFVLSLGFFCREWHFAGTSKGVYVVGAFVGAWFLYRRKAIGGLIKDTPVEIWLWSACLCYGMSLLISRRVFAEKYLGLLPMEELYHIPLEETMETMAHVMLAATCLVAWQQFGFRKDNDDT